MRQMFAEGDLISAEVQQMFSDGAISLHARSLKYGKLVNGVLVQVSCTLIKRLPQHFVSLPCGVDAIIGSNGNIWITPTRKIPTSQTFADDAAAFSAKTAIAAVPLTLDERKRLSRVRNSIVLLRTRGILVDPESIMSIYTVSLDLSIEEESMLSRAAAAAIYDSFDFGKS